LASSKGKKIDWCPRMLDWHGHKGSGNCYLKGNKREKGAREGPYGPYLTPSFKLKVEMEDEKH